MKIISLILSLIILVACSTKFSDKRFDVLEVHSSHKNSLYEKEKNYDEKEVNINIDSEILEEKENKEDKPKEKSWWFN